MAEVFAESAVWRLVLIRCPCARDAPAMAGAPCPLCRSELSVPIRRVHPKAWMCQCRAINADDGVLCGRCKRARGGGPERSLSDLGMPDPGFGPAVDGGY